MIVVTGGVGFIGSRLVKRLNELGQDDILIVDDLWPSEKWRNLMGLFFRDLIHKDDFIDLLERGHMDRGIEAIFHLGACSSTLETDLDYLMENNYRYTLRLARWCVERPSCRFIYASSAATYGDGTCGFLDDEEGLWRLKPLNPYGLSKHLFDLAAYRLGWLNRIVGLKYFNVYGPNEWHKGEMRSAVLKGFLEINQTGCMRLFASDLEGLEDGEQTRDFIYVDDAVEMTLFFMERRDANGVFNIGTGVGRTWNDLARALFHAMGLPVRIQYAPMPEELRGRYQYITCAELTKLRRVQCEHQCLSLEEGVRKYVRQHLIGTP